jgi:hypothetical protein
MWMWMWMMDAGFSKSEGDSVQRHEDDHLLGFHKEEEQRVGCEGRLRMEVFASSSASSAYMMSCDVVPHTQTGE